jgi:translocation and assembly module TamA
MFQISSIFIFGAFLVFFSLTSLFGVEPAVTYDVQFIGIQREDTLELLKSASQLVKLRNHPPKSLASLQRRAEMDIPNLVKALHSQAYYNARIAFDVDTTIMPYVVLFKIETGPVYPFGGFEVLPTSLNIQPQDLGICLFRPAYPLEIFNAEDALIHLLSRKGYPLAKLLDREVIADQKSKEIFVRLYVDPGPLAYFGNVTIEGLCTVKEEFVKRKIHWNLGDVYDPSKIDCTIAALESSRVFSSIGISHADEADHEDKLPITLQVTEGKQRSIGLGIGYSTQRGPGFTAEWEHRNFRGMGERLRASANVLMETQEGTVSYMIPDFHRRGQDLIYATELEHDDTKGYEKTSLSLSAILEKQLTDHLRVSYGGMYEYLKTTSERKDGSKETENFNLARIPLKVRWSNADDPLDPTRGVTLFLKAVPTCQLIEHAFAYTITTLTGSYYKPFSKDKRLILAAKAHIGSIWGSSVDMIPGSDRFYAGSENTLRGYNYETVSPMSEDADPIGGRSLMVYSLEGRWRISKKWGSVLFYDIGNVFSEPLPKFDAKMLQSIGMGIRYYTPVGPLRLDIAVPLNRRRVFDRREMRKKFVDDAYQIYFSVGQSF